QGFGVVEAKEVHVEEHLELRRDLDVRAQVEQEEPGVDEVRLALELAGSETGHEAVAAFELEPRVGQRQALAHPVAEAAAGEIRVVEDHVEAPRRVVVGLSIAGGPEERDPWPEPVEVDGELERGHVRADVVLPVVDWVAPLVADDVIVGMRDVEATQVAIAVPAQPERVHFFSGQCADGRWSHQKPVFVEVLAPRVVQVVAVEHQGVAGPDEVLPEVVDDAEVLASCVEDAIQAAIGVLLERAKVHEVELIPVGAEVAEDAGAEVVVAEDEATEVAGKRLDAEARRDEVVVGAEVAEVVFDEQLLEAYLTVQPRRALPGVDVDDARVSSVEVVDVEHARHAYLPVARPEGRIALEELQGDDEILIEEELIAGTEELGPAGLIGAHVARQRDAAELEQAVADGRDREEVFLAE